jgi:cytochrome bd-type quinol oxidase subunit 2
MGVSLLTGTACWFRLAIGLPCPGCGLTRSFAALLHGAFREAFFWHPLPLLALALLPVAVPLFIVLRRRQQSKAIAATLWVALAVILAVYAVRMLLYFPHTEPLTLHRDALWRLFLRNIIGFNI